MAQNEFFIKCWFISFLTVTAALKVQSIYLYGLLIFSISACFYLFNMQFYIYENQYRELYNKRIKLRTIEKISDDLYLLKIAGFNFKEFRKYFKKGWLLLVFFFVMPTIFVIIVFFINNTVPEDKIIIEIQGIKRIVE